MGLHGASFPAADVRANHRWIARVRLGLMAEKSKIKPSRVAAAVLFVALLALGILFVLKQDDCFPDPEPEPVPCSGENCPVVGEESTGKVEADATTGDSTGQASTSGGVTSE